MIRTGGRRFASTGRLKFPKIVPFSFLSRAENGHRVATTTMNSHFIDAIAIINTIRAGKLSRSRVAACDLIEHQRPEIRISA
jgi:hypothetical protein